MQQWIWPVLATLITATPAIAETGNRLLQWDLIPPIAQAINPASQNPANKTWELVRNARQLAKAGQSGQATATLIQAEQTAAFLSNSNTLDQLLAVIAREQANLGQYDRAIAITQRMSYTTMPLQACCIPVRAEAETAIVQAYLNAGQVNQARRFATSIQFTPARNQVLLPIVAYFANQGQFSEAIRLGQQTGDTADRARATILKGYIGANRLTEGLAFTRTIRNRDERAALLSLLTQWAWRSGRNDLAYQIANQIQEPGNRAQALVEVAMAYAANQQRERAVSILSQGYQLARTQPNNQSFALWADYFAQVGAFDRALAIVNTLKDYEKADARARIARTYASAGQYARAIALVQQVRDGELQPFGDMPDLKVEALYHIIQQAMQAGQDDLALRAVNALNRGQYRVRGLRMLAEHHRNTNQPQKAVAALNQALTAARSVDRITIFLDRNTFFAVPHTGLLIDIAQDFRGLKQPDRALTVLNEALRSARTMKEANPSALLPQVEYLGTIAKQFVQLGQRDRALAAAEIAANLINQFPEAERSSVFPIWTVQPLAAVAQIFFTAGADQQARELLTGLRTVSTTFSDKQQQFWAMVAIVKASAAIGAEPQVRDTAEAALALAQTLEPSQRGWLTERLIVATASAEPTDALQLAQSRLEQANQIPALVQIAVNYHATGQASQAQTVVSRLQQVAASLPDEQREQLLNDAVRNYFAPQSVRNLPISQIMHAETINADLPSSSLKANNWSRIAQAYAFQGEADRAQKAMQLALETAKAIPDRFDRQDLLIQLLEAALQVGETRLANQIASSFAAPYRAAALQRIAFRSP